MLLQLLQCTKTVKRTQMGTVKWILFWYNGLSFFHTRILYVYSLLMLCLENLFNSWELIASIFYNRSRNTASTRTVGLSCRCVFWTWNIAIFTESCKKRSKYADCTYEPRYTGRWEPTYFSFINIDKSYHREMFC